MRSRLLDIELLIAPNIVQQRASGLHEETVDDYAECMERRVEFPPIDVFHDGEIYRVADGFHRLAAAKRVGAIEIRSRVHRGGEKEAIRFACSANQGHGLRRTNADKRKAVKTLLRLMPKRTSDRKIAEIAGVGNQLVGCVRRDVCESHTPPQGAEEVTIAESNYDGSLPLERFDEDAVHEEESLATVAVHDAGEPDEDDLEAEALRLTKRMDKLTEALRAAHSDVAKDKGLRDAMKRLNTTFREMKR